MAIKKPLTLYDGAVSEVKDDDDIQGLQGQRGATGPEGPIAVIEGEDLTILATRQQLEDATVIDYYTSEIQDHAGLNPNLDGPANVIFQTPITKDGIISSAILNNYNTENLSIDIVTKNETGSGFTIVQSFAQTGVVPDGFNEFKFLNIPVVKGQFLALTYDGSLKQSFFGDTARGYWKSTDDYATSDDYHGLDFDFTFVVSAGVKELVETLVDADLVQTVDNIKTLSNYGEVIFNEAARTQTNDGPVNGLSVYGVSIPLGQKGILKSFYFASNTNKVRALIINYIFGKPNIKHIIDAYSDENLEAQKFDIDDDDYMVIDTRVNGGVYAKYDLDTSYQLISYTLPDGYQVGDYIIQGDRSEVSLGFCATIIKDDVVLIEPKIGTVPVFKDDLTTQLPHWVFAGWDYDSDTKTYTNTGTGTGNYLQNLNDYWSDHRKARSFWSFSSDCVWNYNSQLNGDNFNTKFQIDVPNQTIKIFAANNSTTVLDSISVPLVADRDYCVEIEILVFTLYFRVFDTLTGFKYECSYEDLHGVDTGLEHTKYSFYCGSGTATLKREFSVSMVKNPDVTEVGDSITSNTGVTDLTKTYSRLYSAAVPNKKVTITALQGATIGDALPQFENEFKYTRPKYLTIMLGVNNGGSYKNYYQLFLLCRAFGINMILHKIPCALDNNNQNTVNGNMAELANGADFATATAIDNDPTGSGYRGDPDKFYDHIHQNDLGHQSMFNRMLIDTPQLFE